MRFILNPYKTFLKFLNSFIHPFINSVNHSLKGQTHEKFNFERCDEEFDFDR